MSIRARVHYVLNGIVLLSFLLAPLQPVVQPSWTPGEQAQAASISDERDPAATAWPPMMLQESRDVASAVLFRARIVIRHPSDWERLDELGVAVLEKRTVEQEQAADAELGWSTFPVSLAKSDSWEFAIVLTDSDQLKELARLRFEPRHIGELSSLVAAHVDANPGLVNGLQPLLARAEAVREQFNANEMLSDKARAELRALMRALSPELKASLAALAGPDDDGDGLENTEELMWCTDPLNPNSDGDLDGYKDGEEVYALLDFTLPRQVRWGYGPPFRAWPPFVDTIAPGETPTCLLDADHDSIPDLAETGMVGSRVPSESTDNDKFDDGQELFGTTYCTPAGTDNCGYGLLPRNVDYEADFITEDMPNWVLPPGDNLFVAAFPVPEVSVVPDPETGKTWTVERRTTITTIKGEMVEHTKSYETSVTRGESTSIANTVTWNEWEEVSQAVERPIGLRQLSLQGGREWDKIIGGGIIYLGGELLTCISSGIPEALISLGLSIGACIAGDTASNYGWDKMKEGFDGSTPPDVVQPSYSYSIENVDGIVSTGDNATNIINNMDMQGVVNSLDGIQYAISQQGDLLARGLHDISYQISRPRFTETRTSGRSWGGAQTTTHEVYEEHTISEGQAFTTGQNWETAWAVDSSHAADLTFLYTVKNTGTEYAREVSGLVFNIYIGDDKAPAISYPAWEQFTGGKLENLFPVGPNTPPGMDSSRTFSSTRVPLSLEQMKRIDLGERLTIKVESFSYGADEAFYVDAVTGGVTVFIEDGVEDGDESVDMYVLPTWGEDSVQDVLTRYFPHGEDADGNLNSLWTPEFDGINAPTWNEYFLSDIAWWNVYFTQADAGDTPLHQLPAQPGSGILFRFNRDSDRDGYNDRAEFRYYCALPENNPDHIYCTDGHLRPEVHPQPEVLAGYVAKREGDLVTVTLALENTGTFDAYGIDAVMYSPDDTTTIGNNTVGGNGRVRPGNHVAVGSLIKAPDLADWSNSTAKPYAGGNYAGDADRTYTFSANTPGAVGQSSTSVNWDDGTGNSGTIDLGAEYHAPLPVDVTNGLQVGFNTGTIEPGENFAIEALSPRDTFTYTVNSEPYTPPVIVVSYSDPQGSHRFITPVQLPTLDSNLAPATGQMLRGLELAIVAQGTFDPDETNTTDFVFSSPHPEPIEDGHLYLNFVSNGTLVAELPYTLTLQAGPTVYPVTWSTSDFSEEYDPDGDNILIAFWTDAQDNIIDSAARPFNTFADDPEPVFALAPTATTWDFGTVTQGEVLDHTITLANTGYGELLTHVANPLSAGRWSPPAPSSFAVGTNPIGIAYDGANVWVANSGDDTVSKLAASDGEKVGDFAVGSSPCGLAFDGNNVWVTNYDNASITKVRAIDGARLVTYTVDVHPWTILHGGTNLWLTNGDDNTVRSIRPSDGGTLCTAEVGTYHAGIAFDGTYIWVSDTGSNTVRKLRASNCAEASGSPFTVGNEPRGLIFDGASIWVANHADDTVTKLLASDGTVLGTYSVGGGPAAIAFDGASVWVTNSDDNTVSRLRASDGALVGTVAVGNGPEGAVFDGANVWVANNGSNNVSKIASSPISDIGYAQSEIRRLSPADTVSYTISIDTRELPVGAVDRTITIRTSDPAIPTRTVHVTGNIQALSEAAYARRVVGRPLDLEVWVPGDHDAHEWVEFPYTLGPEPQSLHPVKVYSQDYGTLWGMGKYASAFGSGTASYDMFGDGRDGSLTVSSGQTVYVDNVRTQLTGTASAGQKNLSVALTSGFQVGDEVLVIQMQGTEAGRYEFGTIGSIGSSVLTLQDNLQNTYEIGGNSKAQALRVPHYRNITIESGGILSAHAWDSNTGGIVVFRASDAFTVAGSVVLDGKGFRGGAGDYGNNNQWGYQEAQSGEGTLGPSRYNRNYANGNGGGGGLRENSDVKSCGGGGGNGAKASHGWCGASGEGGNPAGTADLRMIALGGGGGAGNPDWPGGDGPGGSGGKGGGILIAVAKQTTVTGSITANGTNGTGGRSGQNNAGGGGGAGGSVLIQTAQADLRNTFVTALGGAGGVGGAGAGGDGAVGRIRIEYCDTFTGTTNPEASVQRLDCYIVEQIESAPYDRARFNLPESFTGGRTYRVDYGRRLVFGDSGEQVTTLRVAGGTHVHAALDALLSDLSAGDLTFKLDIGNDGTWDWQTTQAVTETAILISPELAAAFTGYTTGQTGEVDVPVKVYLSEAGQVLLANLAAMLASNVDLTPGNINFSTAVTTAGVADLQIATVTPTEGDVITVTVPLTNTGAADSGPFTVALFATPTDGLGETYIGAAFVPNVAGNGGTAQAGIEWDTLGFTGDVPVRVVVDPFNRVSEIDDENNEATANVTILTRPDLHVPAIEPSDPEPVAGQSVTVSVTISNAGQTDAGISVLALYEGNPASDGTLIGEQTPAVAGESETTMEFTWVPAAPGLYRLFTVSDREDVVDEFDEGNNQTWRDVYVGFKGPIRLNSGGDPDPAYDPAGGYGYVDEGAIDDTLVCGSETHQTQRKDPGGRVVYRFDHLQPGHYYHLDLTLAECDGEGRQEKVHVDGIPVADPVDLSDGDTHDLSILVGPRLYANRTISVTVEADPRNGAVVAGIALHDIDYRYADSGGTNDPQYPTTLPGESSRAYGWLDGVAPVPQPCDTLPYQSLRIDQSDSDPADDPDNELRYQFDGLDPDRRYQVRLTFYECDGGRTQTVSIDNVDTGPTVDTSDNQRHDEIIDVPPATYASDGSIVVRITRPGYSAGALVNEVALEEVTLVKLSVISDVRISNVRDGSFTVSWLTDIPTTGRVNFGPSSARGTIVHDNRGADTTSKVHYVTVTDLVPQTTYYVDVVSGLSVDDNKGSHYTVTTGPSLQPRASDTIYGQVLQSDETTPVADAVVYIMLQDHDGQDSSGSAALMSSMSNQTGAWSINLGNARSDDLTNYFLYASSGDRVKVEAHAAPGETGCLVTDTANDAPAPELVLDQSQCYRQETLSLGYGWNFLSLPVDPEVAFTAESLCNNMNVQGGSILEIDRWYNDGWDGHICGLPFNNFDIELGQSYFVKTGGPSTWNIGGVPVSSGVPLDLGIGWSSIAVPHSGAYTAETLCGEIESQGVDAVEIDRWHNNGWEGNICGLALNDFAVEQGRGYFVKAAGSGVVTPDASTVSAARDQAPELPAPLQSLAQADVSISRLRVTNVRDGSLSISWITDKPATGYVNFGPTTALSSTAYDDRGAEIVDDTHHVTLSDLAPNTAYFFDIVSGATTDDNGGEPYTVTTGPTLDLPPSDTIYGQVLLADGVTPAQGAIVYITLRDADGLGSSGQSAAMSAVVGKTGYWSANLGNTRAGDLSALFEYSASGDAVVLVAEGGRYGSSSLTVDTGADSPAPAIQLPAGWYSYIYLPIVSR